MSDAEPDEMPWEYTAQEVRDAATHVIKKFTLSKTPDDEHLYQCVDILGEDLFTRLWALAAVVSNRERVHKERES